MVECTQQETGPADYLEQVFTRARQKRVPLSGSLDLTYRCNYRCVHCYVGHLVAQTRSDANERDTAQVLELLAAAADAGCMFLLLSGGEPLLRWDFADIYVRARELGMVVTVFTNASLVTKAHVDVFREFPPRMVEVSVYGATEATYERVTGIPGSFRRARRGIERLLDGGVKVGLKTVVLRDNASEIGAIEDYAGSLGVRFRVDPLLNARLDGDTAPLHQRVDPQEAVDIEMASGNRRADWKDFHERQQRVADIDTRQPSRLYRCSAGVVNFHVDPLGFMRPCLLSVGVAYNVPGNGFVGAWGLVRKAVDETVGPVTGGCSDCALVHLCGYCPGLFALEGASPSDPPEYVCKMGERRFEAISAVTLEVADVDRR